MKNEYSSSHHISAHHRRLLTIYNSVLLTVEVANIKPGAQATTVVDEHLAYCALWQGGGRGAEVDLEVTYDGQYEREAPPERGTLFRLHVYKGC